MELWTRYNTSLVWLGLCLTAKESWLVLLMKLITCAHLFDFLTLSLQLSAVTDTSKITSSSIATPVHSLSVTDFLKPKRKQKF